MPLPPSADASAATNRVASLVLWCARELAAGDQGSPLREDMAHEDWAEFLRACAAHGLLPAAWLALRPWTAGLDAAAVHDLHQAYDANARRNLALLGEMHALMAALARERIVAVSWKGLVLAQRAYGDLAARHFFDLDLLVHRRDVAAAQRVAQALGFRPEKDMTEHEQERYIDHQGELELLRPSDGLWIELHSAVVPTYYGRGLSIDGWWQRVTSVDVGRVTLAALDPVDELQALCVHGSKHRWNRLIWILDVALLARRLDASQLTTLLDSAAHQGTQRMVRLGLMLAADLCAAPIPAAVLASARRDRAAAALARNVARHLFDPRPGRFDALFFHARMRERASDQLRYLANVAFTPSGADWEALHLPRPLFPLYAVTRPVRLVVKYGRRLVSPPRG